MPLILTLERLAWPTKWIQDKQTTEESLVKEKKKEEEEEGRKKGKKKREREKEREPSRKVGGGCWGKTLLVLVFLDRVSLHNGWPGPHSVDQASLLPRSSLSAGIINCFYWA